jgi:hypothetical protein
MRTFLFGRSPGLAPPVRCLVAALTTFVVSSAPGLASAEPQADPYEQLIQEADAALRGKRSREAISAWREAWTLRQSYLVACNLGSVELRHGSVREAAEFLAICLRTWPHTITPEEKKRREGFENDLKKARSHVASLRIVTTESGATIQLDDVRLGLSPLPGEVFAMPGEHTISAELEGHERATAKIHVKEGESVEVPITLLPKPAPRAQSTPPPLAPLAQKAPPPPPSPAPSMALVVGGASLGVVGVSLGAGLFVARSEAKQDALERWRALRFYHQDCAPGTSDPVCESYLSIEQGRAIMKGAAITSFVGAGLALAATAAYALFPRSPTARVVGTGDGITILF